MIDSIALGLAAGLLALQSQVPIQGGFRDPAPPKASELEEVEPPVPLAYDELTIHAAPRPLDPSAVTSDWPGFLGPGHDGRSPETHVVVPAGGPPVVWEMRRGSGYASPVVHGQYLVFTHREGASVHVDCLQAETGERFWRFTYPCDYRGHYIKNGGPRATPVIAGERVYVHGVEGMLHCLDLATGRVVWKRDLEKEFALGDGFFGVVASPIAVGGLLIQNLGAPNGPSVAAFDLETGRLVWGTGDQWGASCASPVLASVHGRPRVFVLTGGKSLPPTGGLMVLDPSTGAQDFSYPFRSRIYESVNGVSPVVAQERVFLTASYGTGSACLALDGEGGFEELWRTRRIGVQFSNPIAVGGHVYLIDGISDRPGAIVCLDSKSGAELSRTDLYWDETVVDEGVEKHLSFSIGEGSMIHVDGRFLCLGDNGHLLWLDCSPEGTEVLARASLFRASESWSPPVLSRGLLYVCQNNREHLGVARAPARLLCYDLRGDGAR